MAQNAARFEASEVVALATGRLCELRDGRLFRISILPELVQGEFLRFMTSFGDVNWVGRPLSNQA